MHLLSLYLLYADLMTAIILSGIVNSLSKVKLLDSEISGGMSE